MSQATVEQRLDRLEQLVDGVLKQLSDKKPHQKNWRKTIGMFDGDPVMQEVIEGALRSREEERSRFYAEFDKEQSSS